jgi:hypothetical protein
VTFNVSGFDQGAPGLWLRRMAGVPSLQDAWISNSTVSEDSQTSQQVVTFTSDASLTDAALSHRADQLPGEDS